MEWRTCSLAKRWRTSAEVDGLQIWYSPSADHWFMESRDPLQTMMKVKAFEDAILVTDAYSMLDVNFVLKLIEER
jgi:hypothetical protein